MYYTLIRFLNKNVSPDFHIEKVVENGKTYHVFYVNSSVPSVEKEELNKIMSYNDIIVFLRDKKIAFLLEDELRIHEIKK